LLVLLLSTVLTGFTVFLLEVCVFIVGWAGPSLNLMLEKHVSQVEIFVHQLFVVFIGVLEIIELLGGAPFTIRFVRLVRGVLKVRIGSLKCTHLIFI
jgi:hypothetical protein